VATIERLREQFAEEGVPKCLQRKTRMYQRLLDGEQEAKLVAIACSEAPAGRSRWTLRLLSERVVELGYVEQISYETVRQTLKKNELKPWRKDCWVIPPGEDAEFVAQRSEVLQLYTSIDNPRYPLVCFDEYSNQLTKETRTPQPMEPGKPAQIMSTSAMAQPTYQNPDCYSCKTI
jgi:hypothetical protein